MKSTASLRLFCTALLVFLSFLPRSLFADSADEYIGYGSLGLALKPLDPAVLPNPNGSKILWWIAFGQWRDDTGIASPEDISYSISIDKKAGTVLFQGAVDGALVNHADFSEVGKLHGTFVFLVTGVAFDVDPVTGLEIFAIGRNAEGSGHVILTSPDNSVDFGGNDRLVINIFDKYLVPSGVNSAPVYGPFSVSPFNFYIGERHEPGDLFFTGTDGKGFSSWLSFEQEFEINGIRFEFGGGDFHGDLVSLPKEECPWPDDETSPATCCCCDSVGELCAITEIDMCVGIGQCSEDQLCSNTQPEEPETLPEKDRCGVCGGSGLSCCQSIDQTDDLRVLDGIGNKQARLIRKLARIVRSLDPVDENKKLAKEISQLAASGANKRWEVIWQNPSVVLQCAALDDSCVDVSTTDVLVSFQKLSSEMLSYEKTLHRIIKRTAEGKLKRRGRKLNRRYMKFERQTEQLLSGLVQSFSECQ